MRRIGHKHGAPGFGKINQVKVIYARFDRITLDFGFIFRHRWKKIDFFSGGCIFGCMQNRDIHEVVRILKNEVKQWRVPAVGHYTQTPFTVLISCVLSLRTQDKTTDAASKRLFPGAVRS